MKKGPHQKNSYNVLYLQVSISDSEKENISSSSSDDDLDNIFAYDKEPEPTLKWMKKRQLLLQETEDR